MSKQTGTIVTIVAAVLTFLCSMTCCIAGAGIAANEWLDLTEFHVKWSYGALSVCSGILVWLVPLLLWLFLVRRKEHAAEE